MIDKGVKYIMYSAPHKSSYLFEKDNKYQCHNLENSLVNTTGSSDSMIGGFLYGVIRGADSKESFKYANAANLATTIANDLSSKEKIEEVFETITIEEF